MGTGVRRRDEPLPLTRADFTASLTQAGASFSVDAVPEDLQRVFDAHHIDHQALVAISGTDHVIRDEELGALFDLLQAGAAQGRQGSLEAASEVYRLLRAAPAAAQSPPPAPLAPGGRAVGLRREMNNDRREGQPPSALAPGQTADVQAPARPEAPEPPPVPTGFEGRDRRVNGRVVRTHTVLAPADELRARQMAALPPAASRPTVRSYLEAIAARDAIAELEASGQRRAAQGLRRPEGVSADQWALTRALQLEGISTRDVESFIATGQLPDLLDENEQVVMTGAERLARLERQATHGGSWTATNSLTFLVGARRAVMAAERQAMQARLTELPADAPLRADLDAAIRASSALDGELGRRLQSIYRSRTYAAGEQGRRLVERAADLERQAAAARDRRDPGTAARLAEDAQRIRDRGATLGQAEGDYRRAMHMRGAADVYRLAARAQIETGTAQVGAMRRGEETLSAQPPAVLGNDDGRGTGNNVRGAGRLLTEASDADGGAPSHAQLGLETARQGALAQFHQLHVERSGYHARVGEDGARPPARTADGERHRQAYFDARAMQGRLAMERIGLYGPVATLPPAEALEVGRLRAEHAGVMQELNAALGTSLSTDRQVEAQRGAVADLDAGAGRAREGERRALSGRDEQRRASADQRDSAEPWTRFFQTRGEERRDGQAVTDANTAEQRSDDQYLGTRASRQAAEARLADGRDLLRGLEVQQTRDRQDAERAQRAMLQLGPSGRSGSIAEAYAGTRRMGDESATLASAALARAESAPGAPSGERALFDIASTRLDLARYWTGTTEVHTAAFGEAGRLGSQARLDTAGRLVDSADASRARLASGSEARQALASGVIRERVTLAVASADERPGVSRAQLRTAEERADGELAANPARLAEARAQIGIGGVHSTVRSDARFEAIYRAGNYDAEAPDALLAQGHRLLGRADLPASPELTAARGLLRRFEANLALAPTLLRRAGRQMENGNALAQAQTGVMSRAEGLAGSVQMSSLITGTVWLVSGFDMKDEVQGLAEDGAGRARRQNAVFTREQVRGANDLATGMERAVQAGQGLRYLNSYRLHGLNNSGTLRLDQAAFTQARDFMRGHFDPARAGSRDWAAFQAAAWPSNSSLGVGSPIAQALRGPVLSYTHSLDAVGDERLAVITFNQQGMLDEARRSLNNTTDGMWLAVGINLSGEVVLALVTLGGSAPSSAAGVVDAANAGRVGLEAASVVRTGGTFARVAESVATFRALHPVLHTGGVALTVGGAMYGANHLAQRAFGNSGATNFVQLASNFIPVGTGARAAELASLGRRTALLGAERSGLARLVSWAALREGLGARSLVAHARFYGPQFAMAGLQLGGSMVAVPAAARAMGAGDNALVQGAMNVVLGAFVASGFSAGMHRMSRRQQSTAVAERLVEASARLGPSEMPQAERARLQQAALREIDAFQAATHGRMPTREETAGLRARLAQHLGAEPGTELGRARTELVEGAVRGLEVQRAGELGLAQAIREERTGAGASTRDRVGAMVTPDELSAARPPTRALVDRAVDLAGQRLFEARGGEAGGASRVQAYRDAAQQIAGTLHAQARQQVEAHGPSAFAESLVQAEGFAGDRAAAVELTARLGLAGDGGQPPVIGPREAARLEPFLAAELSAARQALDGAAPGADLRAHWTGLRDRLTGQQDLSPAAADAVLRTVQGEVFQQAAARRVVAAQVSAGAERPLTNAEIMRIARETAATMGYSQPAAELLARDLAQARPTLEQAGMVRAGGETGPEASFRSFREAHPEVADRFLALTPEQFVAAFGPAPNPARLAQLADLPGFAAAAATNPAATRQILMRGPEPTLAPPAEASVMAARHELAALRPGERLSDGAAHALLQDAVHGARQALLAEHQRYRAMTPAEAFAPDQVAGWCGMGQALTSTRLSELGIPQANLQAHQAAGVFRTSSGQQGYNHAFLVAELPNGRRYLIDTTFRQFFEGGTGPNEIGRPGEIMRRTERGARIADELLERGYVELTPEVAAEYGRALSGDPNSRTFTVADFEAAPRINLDYTRAELNNLPAPPPLQALPGTASAGRPAELGGGELGHVRAGEFRGDRFAGGGHGFDNVAALEAHGYQRTTRETLLAYRDALTTWRRDRAAWQAWQRSRTGDRPTRPGPEPRPADFGLTSERVYFMERNGAGWTGGIFPADNRIHTDGHTWFPAEWGEPQLQQASALLGREGPGVTRADDPSRAKLTAWLRLDPSGRVEVAPPGLADPAAQGYLRVSMIVPTEAAAGRTIFPEMRQR